MTSLFKLDTGLPYWVNHILVAVVIGLALNNFLCGAFYYVGREMRDWEKLGYFDHPGFWAPVIVCSILEVLRVREILPSLWTI